MSEFKKYVRSGFDYRHVLMRPYVPGEDLTGVAFDRYDSQTVGAPPARDVPEAGGMIAMIAGEEDRKWYVSPKDFAAQYTPEDASNANPTPGATVAPTGDAVFGAQPVDKK